MDLQRCGSNLNAIFLQIPYLPDLREFAPKQIDQFETNLQPMQKSK